MKLEVLGYLEPLRLIVKAWYEKELEGNLRLQRMLWAIVFLIMAYFSFLVSDQIGLVKNEAISVSKAYSSLIKQENMSTWHERLEKEEAINLEFRKKLWSASSPGLASADYQTELKRFINFYEMRQWSLNLSEPIPLEGFEGWLIQADIIGKISRDDIPKLIFEIEDEAKYIQIIRLSYNKKSEVMRLLVASRFVKNGEQ